LLVIDIVSNPRAGRTTLLAETVRALGDERRVAGVGDRRTALDATDVARRVDQLGLAPGSIVFIENVGNVDQPSGADLGQSRRIVLWSVEEGVNLPLHCPAAFRAAQLVVLNKIDALSDAPDLAYDYRERVRQTNAAADIILLSAESGEGLGDWFAWLEMQAEMAADMARPTGALA
jgi:hydrogenase nickel incorporation protein HypB